MKGGCTPNLKVAFVFLKTQKLMIELFMTSAILSKIKLYKNAKEASWKEIQLKTSQDIVDGKRQQAGESPFSIPELDWYTLGRGVCVCMHAWTHARYDIPCLVEHFSAIMSNSHGNIRFCPR